MINNTLLRNVLDHIEKYAHGREVVMYGHLPEVRDALNERGCMIRKVFSGNKTVLENKALGCIDINQINGQKDKYYVVLPFLLEDNGVLQRRILNRLGYSEDEDYVFYPSVDFVLNDLNGRSADAYGNIVKGQCKNIQVRISGANNSITIGEGVQIKGTLKIIVNGDNHSVSIGEKCVFNGTNNILTVANSHDAKIEIGSSCRFANLSITYRSQCEIKIGNMSTFSDKTRIYLHKNTKITIGQDCMFSFDIVVQTGDGHTIFDLETGKGINYSINESQEPYYGEIELKDHIWVGRDAMILSGAKKTVIGEGSVIGAKSLVKGVFPNNCIIAGVPARVLKRNIAWSRSVHSDNIDDCKGYTHMTEDFSEEEPQSTSNG